MLSAIGRARTRCPPGLRCVEVNNNSSESEGMILGGYAGYSGDCASSEGSQIEQSDDEDEETEPLSGGLEERRAARSSDTRGERRSRRPPSGGKFAPPEIPPLFGCAAAHNI